LTVDRGTEPIGSLTLRPGQPDDLPAIGRIERVSYHDSWSFDVLRKSLAAPAPSSLVALSADGAVVGYAFFGVGAGELDVHSLTVDPPWRRRGVATRLLERIEQDARAAGVSRLLLEVREGNEPALRLYRRHGFAVDTVRRRYYADGEDAVLMSRALAPEHEGAGGR